MMFMFCFFFYFRIISLLNTATTKTILYTAFIVCTEGHDSGTTLSRLCVLLDARVVQATHKRQPALSEQSTAIFFYLAAS